MLLILDYAYLLGFVVEVGILARQKQWRSIWVNGSDIACRCGCVIIGCATQDDLLKLLSGALCRYTFESKVDDIDPNPSYII